MRFPVSFSDNPVAVRVKQRASTAKGVGWCHSAQKRRHFFHRVGTFSFLPVWHTPRKGVHLSASIQQQSKHQ
jgi:hypothetical protein